MVAWDEMGYADFFARLKAIKSKYPSALDCTRTRFQSGSPLALQAQACAQLRLPTRGHRCHVAQAWAQRFAPWGAVSPAQVLVSQGVRDSLACLMRAWRNDGGRPRRWALPADVYPAYGVIAAAQGVPVQTFGLHPQLALLHGLDADVLLITNPVKPRGTALSASEVAHITTWLSHDPGRRVVVDAVYDLAPALDAGTQALWGTGQAVVLHSLSKAWLSPLVAGVAVVPAVAVDALTPAFRALPSDGAKLAQAEAWLQQQPDFPHQVGAAWGDAKGALMERLQAAGLQTLATGGAAVPGYLLPVACRVKEGAQAGFIGLPASAFGAAWAGQGPVTVFSALEALAQPAAVTVALWRACSSASGVGPETGPSR